jgi:IS5 family transposase
VETTAANVHDLTPAAELLHGEEEEVYADAGYQGFDKRKEMEGIKAKFRIAMRPGKRRVLPETPDVPGVNYVGARLSNCRHAPDGRLQNLVEMAKAHIRAKVEHPFG